MPKSKEPWIKVMVDSGAFSAWSRNEELDLKDYIRFIKDHESLVESYVNMDVIPGAFGKRRSGDDVEDSASRSYANLQKMKDAGLRPIPVYHAGEEFKWLDKMLKDGETYIGISASKDAPRPVQRDWLDQCFSILTDAKGKPLIHTHGFGITLFDFLIRYPWTTSDSTTWSLNAGYGHVYVPPIGIDGKPDYTRKPTPIVMSENRERETGLDKHFDAAFGTGPIRKYDTTRPYITSYLEGLGVDLSEIRYNSDARRKASALYFMAFCDNLKEVTFRFRQPKFPSTTLVKKPIKANRFVIKFATIARNGAFARLLRDIDAKDQLLSYYELKKMASDEVDEFLMTGLKRNYTPLVVKQDWEATSYQTKRRLDLKKRIEEGRTDTEEVS